MSEMKCCKHGLPLNLVECSKCIGCNCRCHEPSPLHKFEYAMYTGCCLNCYDYHQNNNVNQTLSMNQSNMVE